MVYMILKVLKVLKNLKICLNYNNLIVFLYLIGY